MAIMKDKFELLRVGSPRLPIIKGHLKVSLHNCRTGKNEVCYEGDNLVTNALADILANNYMGGLDFNKLTPIWSKWFGGVLCYGNAHTLNANNYYPDPTNPLIAHAGDQAPASAAIVAEDYTRGYPTQTVIGDNFVKQTWEWNSNQGNGNINAISLTHKDTGNVGLGNNSSAFRAFKPFEIINSDALGEIPVTLSGEKNVFAEYDDNHGLAFYIGTDGEYKSGYTKFETNNISVQIKRVINTKLGLFDTPEASYVNVRKFTVNTSVTFYKQPSFYFDKTNKRLWLFTNYSAVTSYSKTAINYTVIDCENESELTYGTFTSDTANLAPISLDRAGNNYNEPNFINIVFDGTYFYFPTSDRDSWNWNSLSSNLYSGFRKINRSTPADQEQVNFSGDFYRQRGGLVNGGYPIFDGAVVRGQTAYVCDNVLTDSDSALINQPDKVSSFVMPMENGGTSSRFIIASKLVNTTLFNLDDTIQKTIEKSLVIEYTLTEASPTP